MKWTNRQPAKVQRAPQLRLPSLVEQLAEYPGRWAEVARYPVDRIGSARSRGANTVTRYPALDYAVEREGAEAVLYFQAKPEARTVSADHTDTEEPKP